MAYKSVIEILDAIKKKDISSSELTRYYLNQIKEKDTDLNCFISVTEEAAISKAQEIDNEISKGDRKSVV